MKGTLRRLRQVREEDRGASLVEYALMVALIAVVCIAAVTQLGGAASSEFSTAGSELASSDEVPADTCATAEDHHYFGSEPNPAVYDGENVNYAGPGWYTGGPGWGVWLKC